MINLDSKEIRDISFSENGREPVVPYKIVVDGQTLNCISWFTKENIIDVYLFHGNGENVSDYLSTYGKIFRKLGCNIFISEYRGYSQSSGRASLLNVLSDAEEVYKKTKIAKKRTIVFGKSFGAIPAIHLATKFQIESLIIDHGIFDVKYWLITKLNEQLYTFQQELKGIVEEIDLYLNNENKIKSYRGDILMFHSRYDSLVNFEHALILEKNARNANVKLIEFNHSDHNNFLVFNLNEYYKEMKEFVDKKRNKTL